MLKAKLWVFAWLAGKGGTRGRLQVDWNFDAHYNCGGVQSIGGVQASRLVFRCAWCRAVGGCKQVDWYFDARGAEQWGGASKSTGISMRIIEARQVDWYFDAQYSSVCVWRGGGRESESSGRANKARQVDWYVDV